MPGPTLEQLLAIETQVWEALASGDSERDGALLADDFLGVYPTGFAGKAEHQGQLTSGPTVASFRLQQARVRVLGPTSAMLSYRAVFRRTVNGAAGPQEVMYVTSIWSNASGRWQNLFSQDTPVTT